LRAYGLEHLHFSREYIIPKPNDHRVLEFVAPAVAEAAMSTGVARVAIDLDGYRERLRGIQQRGRRIVHTVVEKARRDPKTLVLPEGIHPEIVRAAQLIEREQIAKPILLGNPDTIEGIIRDLELDYRPTVIDPATAARAREFGVEIHRLRERKGMTAERAEMLARTPNTFGLMMLRNGEADAYLSGLTADYRGVLRPILQLIPLKAGVTTVSGVFLIMSGDRVYLVADALVNVNPDTQSLAEIAIMTADFARDFDIEPRVAMVSFSNFGSARYPESKKMADAVKIVRERRPDIEIDGEMQADTALSAESAERRFPFSRVKGANVLIFPNLDAATAAYKVVSQLGEAQVLGPILLGPKFSAHPLMPTADEESIMLVAALAVEEASCRKHTFEDIIDEQAELLIPV